MMIYRPPQICGLCIITQSHIQLVYHSKTQTHTFPWYTLLERHSPGGARKSNLWASVYVCMCECLYSTWPLWRQLINQAKLFPICLIVNNNGTLLWEEPGRWIFHITLDRKVKRQWWQLWNGTSVKCVHCVSNNYCLFLHCWLVGCIFDGSYKGLILHD